MSSIITYTIGELSSLKSSVNDFLFPTSPQYNFDSTTEDNMVDDPISQVKGFAREDITNIFNQQNNKDYLLQDIDIHPIVQSQNIHILPILIQDIEKFNEIKTLQHYPSSNKWLSSIYNNINNIMSFVERIFPNNKNYDSTKEALVTAINYLYSSSELATTEVEDNLSLKSKHFIVNLNRNHWTCLSLVINKDNLYILYKDSIEIPSYNKTQIELYIKNIAQYELGMEGTKVKFITNANIEQQDATSCGIFALKNIEIVQQKLKESPEGFLDHFADYNEFCKANDIPALRKEYATEYLNSNIKSILMEPNLYPLSKDKLKDTLKENLHASSKHNLGEQINTYVESYNPNAQLEEAFSTPLCSSIWLLNKNYPAKTYTFQENHEFLAITGAEDSE